METLLMLARRVIVLALVAAPLMAGCVEHPPEIRPAAIAYLETAQGSDGGFSATGNGSSDFSTSAWVALAWSAAGVTGDGPDRLGAYLASQAAAVRSGATGSLSRANAVSLYVLAKLALEFAGDDLTPDLRAFLDNSSLQLNERIFLLGTLGRLGEAPASLHAALKEEVASNRTSMVATDAWFRANAILALLASGGSAAEPYYREATRTLLFFQKHDSGFRSSPEYEPDASTTSVVLAVLIKVPFVYGDEAEMGRTFLEAMQSRSGSVRFSAEYDFSPVKTTAEALLGFTGTGPFTA